MGRSILAAAVGLVTMWVTRNLVELGIGGAMGSGVADPSATQIALAMIVTLTTAGLGGIACCKVASKPVAIKILMGAVLVLGLLGAMLAGAAQILPDAMESAGDTLRAAEMVEITAAIGPMWILWATPFVSALGVLLGARVVKAKT